MLANVQGDLEASPNPRLIFLVPKVLTRAREAAGCGRWDTYEKEPFPWLCF